MVFGIDDLAGGLLFSGIGALGNAISSSKDVDLMREQNAWNAQQAGINRDFQERMSNTAYQRATADMVKAGINPMAAFSQGGASSPSGATASGTAARTTPSDLGKMAASAVDMARLRKDLELADKQGSLMDAQKAKEISQEVLNTTSAKESAMRSKRMAAELPAVVSRSRADKATADYDYENAGVDAVGNRLGFAKPVLDAIRALKPNRSGDWKSRIGRSMKDSETRRLEKAGSKGILVK